VGDAAIGDVALTAVVALPLDRHAAGGLILDSLVRHGSSSAVLRRRVPVPTGSSIHRQVLAPRRSDRRKNHGERVNGQPGSPDEPR